MSLFKKCVHNISGLQIPGALRHIQTADRLDGLVNWKRFSNFSQVDSMTKMLQYGFMFNSKDFQKVYFLLKNFCKNLPCNS